MKFNEQQFFIFDVNFIGIEDLPQVWDLQEEWYNRHTPTVIYKELARETSSSEHPTEVDYLWNEPQDGNLMFERVIKIRSHTVFPENKPTHTKWGTEDLRQDTFYFGLRLLEKADLFPTMGDHIIFSGNTYEVRQVVLEPENFWTEINVPLHITCRCDKFRFGRNIIPSSLLNRNVH